MSSMSISGFVHLRAALLDVRSLDALHVLGVEDGLHRLDRRERLFQLIEQRAFEHTGVQRGFIGGVREDIPTAEHEVIQAREWNKVFDLRRSAVGALFPSRMVAIWVREPMGLPNPRRIASTPAKNVVVTAPIPGIRMPSFPSAGAIWTLSFPGNYDLLEVRNPKVREAL